MKLTFLEAAVPLTKKFTKKENGEFERSSYPDVTRVTSHEETADTIPEFSEALSKHAALGNCLLTTGLVRPLVNESRAKMSDDAPRQWLVLDVDGFNYPSIDNFVVDILPDPFHKVSYITQYSPSHGIKDGIRAHVFFMLESEVSAKIVSNWLKRMNLATEKLRNQVTLSPSAMALKWPLDIVANNNARIIYITPPECVGFDDPLEKRIEVHEKEFVKLSFNFASVSSAKLQTDVRTMVNALRVDVGLPERKAQTFYEVGSDGMERLRKDLTPAGKITGYQADNDYFMRCNLDGGDSWAYYYHRHRGNWLHNFKGEPALHLPTLDPEFYNSVIKPDATKLHERENRPFVFRDTVTDKYYAGMRKGNEIIEQPHIIGSEKKIEDYFVVKGATSPPANIEPWRRAFDPTLESQWNPDDRIFNFWRPTDYMKNATYRSNPPETVDKVIRHVTGDNEEAYEYFINWLAFIFQTRQKSNQAWVLHGCPGTGKGLLSNSIIRPLFGTEYTQQLQIRDLKSQFNGFMEFAIMINVDETNVEDAGIDQSAVVEALKMWITEPMIQIEAKNQNSRMAKNFSNFLFTTNNFGGLPIQRGDRRFSVAPRQDNPLEISREEILEQLPAELAHFAGFLSGYQVDYINATKPLANKAKESLRKASMTTIDGFAHAVTSGDLKYFIEGVREDTKEFQAKEDFKKALSIWINDAKHARASHVAQHDLKAAYVVMCMGHTVLTQKFLRTMSLRDCPPNEENDGAETWIGWKVDWKLDDKLKKSLKLHLKAIPSESKMEDKIKDEINATSPS